jgi:hypothetical protein
MAAQPSTILRITILPDPYDIYNIGTISEKVNSTSSFPTAPELLGTARGIGMKNYGMAIPITIVIEYDVLGTATSKTGYGSVEMHRTE